MRAERNCSSNIKNIFVLKCVLGDFEKLWFLLQWLHLGIRSCPCGKRLKGNRQIQYKIKLTACVQSIWSERPLSVWKTSLVKTCWLLAQIAVRNKPTHRCKKDNIDKVIILTLKSELQLACTQHIVLWYLGCRRQDLREIKATVRK